ncbi:MAG TPA: hypothetical protein VLA35_07020, partial [Thermoleophilia bacterium]|nr:hypothetical protein [Thermoleophilia bacterium]
MTMRERSDTLERIRRGYRALGLGANRDVAAMFEDDGDASSALDGDASSALFPDASSTHGAESREGADCGAPGGAPYPYRREDAEWVVFDVINGQPWATRDLVALDLFGGLPPHWDLVGVDVEHW